MNITIEKIEEIIKRTDVSYEDAKKALEISDGSVVDAIIHLEDEPSIPSEKNKPQKQTEKKTNQKNEKNLLEYLQYNLSFRKNNVDRFSLPIWLFLIAFLFAHKLIIIALIIALLTKHKIHLDKSK